MKNIILICIINLKETNTYRYNMFIKTRLNQIDKKIRTRTTTPQGGWIKTLRNALSMPIDQLAKRLNISSMGVVKLEKREELGHITLNKLQEVANKLDADLMYAIIPRKKLTDLIDQQAEKKATEIVLRVNHSMSLEQQGLEKEAIAEEIAIVKDQLLHGNLKKIWDETE